MSKKLPRYLNREPSRHGDICYYVRMNGKRTRIKQAYDSPEFWSEYHAIMQGTFAEKKSNKKPKPKKETLAWLIDLYKASAGYQSYKASTREKRDGFYTAISDKTGHEFIEDITSQTIIKGRNKRAATPHAANSFLRDMGSLFSYAFENGLVESNPVAGVKRLKIKSNGHLAWATNDIEKYRAYWQLGTMQRLTLDLLIETGLRRSDVVRLGWQHYDEKNNLFSIDTEKSEGNTNEQAHFILTDVLRKSIEAVEKNEQKGKIQALSFIKNKNGTSKTSESFGFWFKNAIVEAGITGEIRAHGLRKTAAANLANSKASEHELMAKFGWTSSQMAQLYTKSANRKALAKQAGERLENVNNVLPRKSKTN